MSTEQFIGEVKIFGFYFQVRGDSLCMGQTLSIAQYSALYALIGTTYGGDGVQTFKLPDLQGRMPIGQGQGPGLPSYTIGQAAGSPNVTLNNSNLPAHIHSAVGIQVSMPVSTGGADTSSPDQAYLADRGAEVYSSLAQGGNYGPLNVGGSTSVAGANTPFSIANPYLVLNYSIALEGIFPSRP